MPLTFQPKLDKVVELLLYLAHKRPGADKYQASKFFYFADREHLARYGRPISYEPYFALWYGPVPTHALDLLEQDARVLRQAGIEKLPFEIEQGKAANGSDTTFIRKPLREVNFDLFSKSDIKVFDDVIAKYGNSSFKELMDITHEHQAYKQAWENRRHGGNRAEMYYEEMIEDEGRRRALIDDIAPVSAHM